MQIFIVLNLIKILAGASVIYLAYNYIDLSKDFLIGILVMGGGIFIFLRGVSFFLLWGILSIFNKNYKGNILTAYKYTGLFAFYILINFLLLGLNFWNKWIGFALTICFLIIGILI